MARVPGDSTSSVHVTFVFPAATSAHFFFWVFDHWPNFPVENAPPIVDWPSDFTMRSPGWRPALAAAVLGTTALIIGANFENQIVTTFGCFPE